MVLAVERLNNRKMEVLILYATTLTLVLTGTRRITCSGWTSATFMACHAPWTACLSSPSGSRGVHRRRPIHIRLARCSCVRPMHAPAMTFQASGLKSPISEPLGRETARHSRNFSGSRNSRGQYCWHLALVLRQTLSSHDHLLVLSGPLPPDHDYSFSYCSLLS